MTKMPPSASRSFEFRHSFTTRHSSFGDDTQTSEASFSPQSATRNSINPFAVFGSEDRQLFHHELRFSDRADHVRSGGAIPLPRHALASMAAPTPHVSAVREIAPVDP